MFIVGPSTVHNIAPGTTCSAMFDSACDAVTSIGAAPHNTTTNPPELFFQTYHRGCTNGILIVMHCRFTAFGCTVFAITPTVSATSVLQNSLMPFKQVQMMPRMLYFPLNPTALSALALSAARDQQHKTTRQPRSLPHSSHVRTRRQTFVGTNGSLLQPLAPVSLGKTQLGAPDFSNAIIVLAQRHAVANRHDAERHSLCFKLYAPNFQRRHRRRHSAMPSPIGTMLSVTRSSASSLALNSRSATTFLSESCRGH